MIMVKSVAGGEQKEKIELKIYDGVRGHGYATYNTPMLCNAGSLKPFNAIQY
jgi:hypothetical protein